jgi:hypothetical protein
MRANTPCTGERGNRGIPGNPDRSYQDYHAYHASGNTATGIEVRATPPDHLLPRQLARHHEPGAGQLLRPDPALLPYRNHGHVVCPSCGTDPDDFVIHRCASHSLHWTHEWSILFFKRLEGRGVKVNGLSSEWSITAWTRVPESVVTGVFRVIRIDLTPVTMLTTLPGTRHRVSRPVQHRRTISCHVSSFGTTVTSCAVDRRPS